MTKSIQLVTLPAAHRQGLQGEITTNADVMRILAKARQAY
jgi:hypothetical protein